MTAPRPWVLLSLVTALVAAVYAPALEGGFLWDDRHLVVHSAFVRELQPLAHYFRAPFWSGAENGPLVGIHYRPLTIYTLALDHRLHGDNPSGFHLTNVALHALNAGLVFALARRRGASGVVAALLGAGFGLSPRLAEAAAWISGRTDLLAAAFTLGALLVWKSDSAPRRALAAGLLLLGLFSKEVAAAGVAALAVQALLEARGRPLADKALRVLPLFVVVALYAGLRLSASSTLTGQRPDTAPGLLTPLEAIGRYAWMTLNPFQPRTQIGQVTVVSHGFVALGVSVFAASCAALHRGRRRLSAGDWTVLCLGGVAIGLVLHAVPLTINVVAADRFLYLPLAALAVLLAPALEAALQRRRALVLSAATLVVGALAVRTSSRVADFADEPRFWADALETTPATNNLPLVELGGVYYRAGLYRHALELYRRAAAVPDSEPGSVRGNLAICLGWLGAYGEARAHFEELAVLYPNVPKFWLDRALLELHALDFAAAESAARRALALHPDYAQARDVLALTAELRREAPELAAGDASDTPGRYARARFASRAGRYPDAVRAWHALLEANDAGGEIVTAALEYLVRFDEPAAAARALARSALHRPAPPTFEGALATRLELARDLEALWRGLGFPEPGLPGA